MIRTFQTDVERSFRRKNIDQPGTTIAICLLLLVPASSALAQQQQERSRTIEQAGTLNDGMLRNVLTSRLAEKRSLAGADIQVSVNNGTVTLAGKVPTQEARQRAERIAQRTVSVREVQNQLTVDPQVAQAWNTTNLTGEALEKQIAQILAKDVFPSAEAAEGLIYGWEVEGPNYEFDIDADDGTITLEGSVPNFDVISQVVARVRKVPGVRSVNSELWVKNYNPYRSYPYGYGWGYSYPVW